MIRSQATSLLHSLKALIIAAFSTTGWGYAMRWITGLLLLFASVLKGYSLAFEPSFFALGTLRQILSAVQVIVEYGLALLVLSGLYWHRLRWIVLVLFVGFACYSLYLAIGGVTSCNCFGPVAMSPWWTFLLDFAIVFGLLWKVCGRRQVRDNELAQVPSASRLAIAGFLFAVSVIGFTATLLSTHGHAQSGLIAQSGRLVILEPENWIGQELPIAAYIDVDLSHGRWTVLLHRHDCSQCKKELYKYEQLAYEERVALVEVPPFADSISPNSGAAIYARLSSDREWFVQTPVKIVLEDGLVVTASNHHGE
jgi:hypothetical protein